MKGKLSRYFEERFFPTGPKSSAAWFYLARPNHYKCFYPLCTPWNTMKPYLTKFLPEKWICYLDSPFSFIQNSMWSVFCILGYYLVGYVYPKRRKGFFGFGREKTIRWLEIFLTSDKQQVKNFIKLYFDRKSNELYTQIRKLEKFGEIGAQN